MGTVFTPINGLIKHVDASETHCEGAKYFIAIGEEVWDENQDPQLVIKIQMMYDGKRSGRKAPSYPVASDDWKEVSKAVEELLEKYNSNKKGL